MKLYHFPNETIIFTKIHSPNFNCSLTSNGLSLKTRQTFELIMKLMIVKTEKKVEMNDWLLFICEFNSLTARESFQNQHHDYRFFNWIEKCFTNPKSKKTSCEHKQHSNSTQFQSDKSSAFICFTQVSHDTVHIYTHTYCQLLCKYIFICTVAIHF